MKDTAVYILNINDFDDLVDTIFEMDITHFVTYEDTDNDKDSLNRLIDDILEDKIDTVIAKNIDYFNKDFFDILVAKGVNFYSKDL